MEDIVRVHGILTVLETTGLSDGGSEIQFAR